MQAVSRAEQAIEQLSVNFDAWMQAEVRKLTAARESARAAGLSGQALDALFSVAHDLKGQATTLGYPFAADVCISLCRLIDSCAGRARIPEELVDHHVDAVAAIVREKAKGHDHPKASILARKLGDVTADYIAQISRRIRHAA
jgi:chemotaxis protein histidine kinase CheA